MHNRDEGDEAMKDKNVNVVQQPRIFEKSFTAITVVLLMKRRIRLLDSTSSCIMIFFITLTNNVLSP